MRLRRLGTYGLGLVLVVFGLSAAPPTAQAADPIPIAQIQGTAASTPRYREIVTTTPSVVTAVYGQGATAELRGFVIQTPGTGGAGRDLSRASDAVFVFMNNTAFDVAIGDVVSVTGTAGEFSGLTQIAGAVTITEVEGQLPGRRAAHWAALGRDDRSPREPGVDAVRELGAVHHQRHVPAAPLRRAGPDQCRAAAAAH